MVELNYTNYFDDLGDAINEERRKMLKATSMQKDALAKTYGAQLAQLSNFEDNQTAKIADRGLNQGLLEDFRAARGKRARPELRAIQKSTQSQLRLIREARDAYLQDIAAAIPLHKQAMDAAAAAAGNAISSGGGGGGYGYGGGGSSEGLLDELAKYESATPQDENYGIGGDLQEWAFERAFREAGVDVNSVSQDPATFNFINYIGNAATDLLTSVNVPTEQAVAEALLLYQNDPNTPVVSQEQAMIAEAVVTNLLKLQRSDEDAFADPKRIPMILPNGDFFPHAYYEGPMLPDDGKKDTTGTIDLAAWINNPDMLHDLVKEPEDKEESDVGFKHGYDTIGLVAKNWDKWSQTQPSARDERNQIRLAQIARIQQQQRLAAQAAAAARRDAIASTTTSAPVGMDFYTWLAQQQQQEANPYAGYVFAGPGA